MNKLGIGERAPWDDFPEVIRNGDLGALKNEPEYVAAKSGNMPAAFELVHRLLIDETVEAIRERIGDCKPVVLPVLAVEASGNNKIPLAMAEVLADRLGLDVSLNIIQSVKVGRTDSGADHRLAFNPTFEGEVTQGQKYLIVDDTLTMGGTVASLRGYVENRGGKVVAAAVMTAHEGTLKLPVKISMLASIESKHSSGMNQFWLETFGYEIDKLTQGEAGHLKSAKSVDAIRERILAARHEGIERLGANRIEAPTSSRGEGRSGVKVEQNYQEMLAIYTEAKHRQVESVETRLVNLIDQQRMRLQQTQSSHPGFFSMPRTRNTWKLSLIQQKSRLQTLQSRLEIVIEIKEGIGLYSMRVEELATRKMRAQNPELADNWDSLQQAKRQHQAPIKKQEQELKQDKKKRGGRTLGR
ncbi:phosphoribosyltransferase [Shewanella khirikhana]|uniref:Adenine phosphoribosyltransferase n=1 Tax=Shewanella khirikhana TaxID=1965282 RepID=A0ABM8HK30_9GAMM|nr:phosphoribosyltransferase [Shewanella khirikhana]AZQ13299.1 adenine phosphoribosyltransferase [Shewanella khirikhana]